jgi:hypothetical protein
MDRRIQVTSAAKFPLSTCGRIFARFAQGAPSFGTGVLVGDTHVLTAAHTVFDHKVRATDVHFMAGQNGLDRPFGIIKCTDVHIFPQFLKSGDEDFDLAILRLGEPIGKEGAAGHQRIFALPKEQLQGAAVRSRATRSRRRPTDRRCSQDRAASPARPWSGSGTRATRAAAIAGPGSRSPIPSSGR